MDTKRRIGFTAFSMPESFELAGAVQILKDARKAGFGHVQFLINPDKRPDYYTGVRRAAEGEGIKLSGLYATFCAGLTASCPVLFPDRAFDDATQCIKNARLMLGDGGILCSPSLLRGLGDPNKGLAGPDDAKLQAQFLQKLQPVAAGEKVVLCVEPINRFETRGPNAVAAALSLIKEAGLLGSVKVLVDTCHSFLERGSTEYADVWRNAADSIGLVHLSDINRGPFTGTRVISDRVADVLNMALRNVDVVFEGFTRRSPDGFFSPLMVHEPADEAVLTMFERDRAWLMDKVNFAA